MAEDTRYPYTYACDLICTMVGYDGSGTELNRLDAAKIYSGIALILGMEPGDLARKLADHYKSNEAKIFEKNVTEFLVLYQ